MYKRGHKELLQSYIVSIDNRSKEVASSGKG